MLGGQVRRGHTRVVLAAKKRAMECSRWGTSSDWMGRAGEAAGWGGSSEGAGLGRDRVKAIRRRRFLTGGPAAVAGLEDESWEAGRNGKLASGKWI